MASSSYYRNQMDYYKNKKNSSLKEKSKYEKILDKLRKIKDGLPIIYDELVKAENKFKDGGYIDNGETFDRGVLKESYDLLDDDITMLNEIIKKYESKIRDLSSNISYYERKYNSNKKLYDAGVQSEAIN